MTPTVMDAFRENLVVDTTFTPQLLHQPLFPLVLPSNIVLGAHNLYHMILSWSYMGELKTK